MTSHTKNPRNQVTILKGFDPNLIPILIRNEYLEDRPRSGRPKKMTEDLSQTLVDKELNLTHAVSVARKYLFSTAGCKRYVLLGFLP